MTDHLTAERIAAFVSGSLGDHTAALVAEHLDDCAQCTARVAAADPLTRALQLPEPPVPAHLVAAVLEQVSPRAPRQAPTELWAGLGLLGAAALAYVAVLDLPVFLTRLQVLGAALGTASGQLRAQPALLLSLGASSLALTLAAVATMSFARERVR